MDDFFSDLVPIKKASESKADDAKVSGAFSDDAVISAHAEPQSTTKPVSSTSTEASITPVSSPLPVLQPMGESRHKKEVREFEQTVQVLLESTFKRFAGGLQGVLEHIQRFVCQPRMYCYSCTVLRETCMLRWNATHCDLIMMNTSQEHLLRLRAWCDPASTSQLYIMVDA